MMLWDAYPPHPVEVAPEPPDRDTWQPGAEEMPDDTCRRVYQWATDAWEDDIGPAHAATIAGEAGVAVGDAAWAVRWLAAAGWLVYVATDADGWDVYRRVPLGRWRALRDDPLPW